MLSKKICSLSFPISNQQAGPFLQYLGHPDVVSPVLEFSDVAAVVHYSFFIIFVMTLVLH
jgi:hypothetical protein